MDTRKTTLIPILLIRGYQMATAAWPHHCRFTPSCSHYMADALNGSGFSRGLWLGVLRILKCHPWHPGGYDPFDVILAKAGIHQP